MAYLTFAEYGEFKYTEMTEEEFNRLIGKTSDFMDSQTRNFYQFKNIELDIPFRRNKFKRALALQVEYMYQSDSTSSYDVNTPQTWSIGRTNVSEASRYSNTGRNEAPSILSDDALLALSGTGLLYRGLGGIN